MRCADQTRLSPTPPFVSPPRLLIRLILTVMHKSLQHEAGWLAGNATDPRRVEGWGIKRRKTPPLKKKKKGVKRKSMFPPSADRERCLRMLPLCSLFSSKEARVFVSGWFSLPLTCSTLKSYAEVKSKSSLSPTPHSLCEVE